jgi:hypothetical protein
VAQLLIATPTHCRLHSEAAEDMLSDSCSYDLNPNYNSHVSLLLDLI